MNKIRESGIQRIRESGIQRIRDPENQGIMNPENQKIMIYMCDFSYFFTVTYDDMKLKSNISNNNEKNVILN
jgi:hypothetical protein